MAILYHIPICPFCQRLEILAELKGIDSDELRFEVVDITRPRSEHLLQLTGGSTALPVLELEGGRSLKESLVLMDYVEARWPETRVRRDDPYERGVENLLASMENQLVTSGYRLVMNQKRERRDTLVDEYLGIHREIDRFLRRYSVGEGPWLFDRLGWAEAVYAPMFQRFWFVEYYEDVDLPPTEDFDRVREWREACRAASETQQTSYEEIVKLYYDYARGEGNGGLPEGRRVSSFTFEPLWSQRPWPPQDKYSPGATDAELGLVA